MDGARRLLGGDGDSGSLLGLAHDAGLSMASYGWATDIINWRHWQGQGALINIAGWLGFYRVINLL